MHEIEMSARNEQKKEMNGTVYSYMMVTPWYLKNMVLKILIYKLLVFQDVSKDTRGLPK